MEAREVDLAGRHQKVAMDEVDQAVRQVGREVTGRSRWRRLYAGGG